MLQYKAQQELDLRLKITQGDLSAEDVQTKYKLDDQDDSEREQEYYSYDDIFLGDVKNKFANELISPCNCVQKWHRRCIREEIVKKEITEC